MSTLRPATRGGAVQERRRSCKRRRLSTSGRATRKGDGAGDEEEVPEKVRTMQELLKGRSEGCPEDLMWRLRRRCRRRRGCR